MRRSTVSPIALCRPGRLALLAGAAALGIGLLAAPASADAAAPASPLVTPSTTGPVTVGTPMTMTVHQGSAADHVYGYAWTWGPAANAPTYSSLPACGAPDTGAVHFVCGTSAKLRVSPEQAPQASFTVWAFDAAGDRSTATTVSVTVPHDVSALYPVTHQWTTDQFWSVPAPAECPAGTATVECVPDTAGVDAQHADGSRPLLLPSGVTWDGSGSGVPGVLTFGAGNRFPAATSGPVVDLHQSFTAGAWLTPTAMPAGTAATALAEESGGRGFELGLTPDGHWQFRVHGPAGEAVAVAPFGAMAGPAVHVAGVADAVNHEVRLYVNHSLAAVAGYTPAPWHARDGVATVGGRLLRNGTAERWIGRVGNPVLAQAPLTDVDLSLLANEMFFPGGNSDLG